MSRNPSPVLVLVVLLAGAVVCLIPAVNARVLFRGESSELDHEQLIHHVISKRSFNNLGCLGTYDKQAFARLDRICEDCYNMYREPGLHHMCRSKCFTSETFGNCARALLIDIEKDPVLQDMVNRLYRRE